MNNEHWDKISDLTTKFVNDHGRLFNGMTDEIPKGGTPFLELHDACASRLHELGKDRTVKTDVLVTKLKKLYQEKLNRLDKQDLGAEMQDLTQENRKLPKHSNLLSLFLVLLAIGDYYVLKKGGHKMTQQQLANTLASVFGEDMSTSSVNDFIKRIDKQQFVKLAHAKDMLIDYPETRMMQYFEQFINGELDAGQVSKLIKKNGIDWGNLPFGRFAKRTGMTFARRSLDLLPDFTTSEQFGAWDYDGVMSGKQIDYFERALNLASETDDGQQPESQLTPVRLLDVSKTKIL
jgi:hypothetical protein